MSSIKAIETSYAGCRFRSRLEARWAVFFDTLGIRWEYEAQGYECQRRLGLSGPQDETFWYLPDFWLPELEVYAEVKGSLTEPETRQLLDAAAYLSAPQGGCGDTDVIVLGPVPRDEAVYSRLPAVLHMHKGDLREYVWLPPYRPEVDWGYALTLADDENGWHAWAGQENAGKIVADTAQLLVSDRMSSERMTALLSKPGNSRVLAAYAAARSARFEHGESGAPGRGPR